MITAKQAKALTSDVKQSREQYWKDFNEIIDENHIKKVEAAIKEPVAIYWGYAILCFGDMGKATIAHLESLGYKIKINHTPGCDYTIAW